MSKVKYVLDTSILFENIKREPDFVPQYLFENNYQRLYALHLVLIEFRLGLLLTWIKFYLEVYATRDRRSVRMKTSNSFSTREKGLDIILNELSLTLHSSVQGEVDDYLAQVESCIIYADKSVSTIIEKYTGNFDDNPISTFKINSAKDFENFVKTCEENRILDLSSYFTKNRNKLAVIKEYITNSKFTVKEKPYAETIFKLVDFALSNPEKCNMVSHNRKYGDITIALDATANYTILTTDNSFKILCPALTKPHIVTTMA